MSPAPRYRAVVFDYAGVMTIPLSQARRVPSDVAVDRKALRQAMSVHMNGDDPQSMWARLERGEIALAEFIAVVEAQVPNAGVMFHPESPTSGLANLPVRADMIERVRALRALGIRTALCTNNVAEWRPLWQRQLPDGLFDAVVDSSAVGMRKPEARIFHHVLGLLGTEPGHAVFLDDLPANVIGARAVGMHAIHVADDDAHLDTLDQLFG